MSKSTVAFFFALLVIVVLIARYNSRSRSAAERADQASRPVSQLVPASPPSSTNVSPVPPASASAPIVKEQSVDFTTVASQVQPAIVLISVFEPSGKLLKTGTGFFVSDEGQIITSRSLMEGGAHAVATTSDGRTENISGILAEAGSVDLAVVKAQVKKRVPFVSASKESSAKEGTKVAVIGSPLSKAKPAFFERTISKRGSDVNGDWLELSMSVPNQLIGSPVMNEHGAVIGLVTRGPGNPPVIVRTSPALDTALAQVSTDEKSKWLAPEIKQEVPTSPAEGPVKKVPLAGTPHTGKSKLVYNPAPEYPNAVRYSDGMIKGNGRFQVTFGPNGKVRDVTVLQSTRNGKMDQAAVEALRRWKSEPGQEWTLAVAITFQP